MNWIRMVGSSSNATSLSAAREGEGENWGVDARAEQGNDRT
jgi:hypothetical protein